MSTIAHRVAPFDAIRNVRPDGSEYWSARALMPVMGYASWRNFKVPVDRARTSAMNQGVDVNRQFAGSRNLADRAQGGGNGSEDYELSRFAAYLVAMNGDPNKREVAAAQAYFAVKTREAETTRPLSPDEIIHQALTISVERVAALAATVEQQGARLRLVEPKAAAFDRWLSSSVDYSADQAAKALAAAGATKLPTGKTTGRNKLLEWMGLPKDRGGIEWVFRNSRGHWVPYQHQGPTGAKRLNVKLGKYEDQNTGIEHGTVTVRVTPKGVADLAVVLGVLPEAAADYLDGAHREAA